MSAGESLTKAPTVRETVDEILADKAAAERLPQHVGWFILRQEPTGGNKRLSEIVGLLKDILLVLRDGYVDYDAARLRILAIDIWGPWLFYLKPMIGI